jgi:catechol 2,3-dioxygenase-like lactoylglutathione lyase family enzyme
LNLAALSPVPFENVYHIGVVVADINRAIAELSNQLGIAFEPPAAVSVGAEYRGAFSQHTVTVSYGRQGPPYLELLQGTPGGIWAAQDEPRMHHLGVWVDDLAGEVKRLETAGMRVEMLGKDAAGNPRLFAYLRNDHGVRVELVDSVGRPALIARLSASASA